MNGEDSEKLENLDLRTMCENVHIIIYKWILFFIFCEQSKIILKYKYLVTTFYRIFKIQAVFYN